MKDEAHEAKIEAVFGIDVAEVIASVERRARIRDLWERDKDDSRKWGALRKIYAEMLPFIEDGQCDPYFIDWLSVFTPIERDMWMSIRILGLPFYPQFPVGRYFVDFADPVHRIAIECDGKQWHDAAKDAIRDADMRAMGWRVWRFTGSECVRGEDDPQSAHQRLAELSAGLYLRCTEEEFH